MKKKTYCERLEEVKIKINSGVIKPFEPEIPEELRDSLSALLESEEAEIDRSNIPPYHPIDLRELASHFAPKVKPFIPGFVYNHYNKLLHLDDFNPVFDTLHGGTGQNFLTSVKNYLDLHLLLDGPGAEEMKRLTDKPVMFASNHPYGGPEGILVFEYLHRLFPRGRILVQSFLKFIRPFSEVCVYNKKDIDSLNKAADERRPLYYYPAGYCSRRLKSGEVFDYDWKSSFVRIAKKNNMPIIIMYVHGQLSKRTLRLTSLRTALGIKFSIESMYLPEEVFRTEGQTIRVTCSRVIDPAVLTGDVEPREWAARLREYCHTLKTDPEAYFDPKKPATLPVR